MRTIQKHLMRHEPCADFSRCSCGWVYRLTDSSDWATWTGHVSATWMEARDARREREKGKLRARRSYISLDSRNTRTVIISDKGVVTHRLSAFEMTRARNTRKRDLPGDYETPTRDVNTAMHVRDLITAGPCCYAFYCHVTEQVKLGLTNNVLTRWSGLEMGGGRPLQLLAVWPTRRNVDKERELHQMFADDRQIGEWFTARPVVEWLQGVCEERGVDINRKELNHV